ncbi:MAG: DoxX family protein [Acidimicrobiia bacterium]|nr:DoxX family protein [Acidimicrobiia bacterium]MDH5288818.1 DoxX family protein [Acidimicrobiia bacterium]
MEALVSTYAKLRSPLSRVGPWAPTFLRVVLGLTMFWHGYKKFDDGLDVYEDFFRSIGIPAAGIMTPITAVLEFVGGLLIVAGAATRLLSLLFIVQLVVAVIKAKYGRDIGFIGSGTAGAELDWTLIAGFVMLAVGGPGPFSADAKLGLERTERPSVGV